MITLFQIDKSGSDLFEKDYSIVIVVDKKDIYGVNIPQKIKDEIISRFKKGELSINGPTEKTKKNRLRIRFHTAVIIQLINQIIRDLGYVEEINIEICNDIDGHFHEIKYMLFNHFMKLVPGLKLEDIVLTKFQKPSLIDDAGKAFRNKDRNKLKEYNQLNLNLGETISLVRK